MLTLQEQIKPDKGPYNIQILTLAELRKSEKDACEDSFAQFVRSAWRVLQPSIEIIWNWHHDYLCDTLQAEMERVGNKEPRKFRYLICNVCPGATKSFIFTRMANAWAWIHWPWMRFISSSYASDLSIEHSGDTRSIIKSDWYQCNWGDRFTMLKHRDSVSHFENNMGGMRAATSTGSKVTGRHAHFVINDDPLNPEEAAYDTTLNIARRFCTETLESRLLPNGMFWYVMQRLNEKDPTGYFIEKRRSKVKWICIPSEITSNIKPEPPELEKFYIDNLFFPGYPEFSREELTSKRLDNPTMYACQFLQRPAPEEGGMFKRQNWKFWTPAGTYLPPIKVEVGTEIFACDNVELPESFDVVTNSWDFTFKDKAKSDYVSGHVIAQKVANFFVMDEHHKKIDYHQSKLEVIAMKKKWPLTSTIYYEDKANGPAIASELSGLVEGMEPVGADGSEGPYTRAVVVSSIQKTGNIILPHPHICSWVNDLIEEFAAFPNGRHDDRVASICQAVHKIRKSKPVIPGYVQKLESYKVHWRELDNDSRLFISQYVGANLSSSIIMALWSTRTGRLLVFDEFTVNTTILEYIKPMLEIKITRASEGAITKLDKFSWYGDASMFARSRSSAALRSLVHVDSISETYIRSGINLQDNIIYNELNSIMVLQRMVVAGSVLFDARAAETSRQVSAWQYEGGDPAPGFGCARALCNIISVLYEAAKTQQKPMELKYYSDQRQRILEELDRRENDEDIDRWIKLHESGRSYNEAKAGAVKPEDAWML